MGVSEYNRFQNDFPDRIKGKIIKEDNLLNVLNALYDNVLNNRTKKVSIMDTFCLYFIYIERPF